MALWQRSRRLSGLLSVLVVGLGVTLVPAPADAMNFGPTQVPLSDPGPAGCPTGNYVATNSGSPSSPFFVLKNPGPGGCAPGIDVLKDPGPSQAPQGIAVALPLAAANCTQGTALFDTELLLLGAPVPGSPAVGSLGLSGGPTSVCPGGDAALAGLQAAIANVPSAPGSFGIDLGAPVALPAVQNPGGYILVHPGANSGPDLGGFYGDTLSRASVGAEVVVDFLEGDPDRPILTSSPTATPGTSILKAPGPLGASTLGDVVCIEIGAIWHQAGVCEVMGGGTVSNSFAVPPLTTLIVDPGGSLSVNGGTLTLGGTPANPGVLSLSSGGVLDLGPGATIDDNGGTLSLGGNTTNSGSVTIDPTGVTTIQQGASLVNDGTLTNDGSLINNGMLVNNGSFVNQGAFADNGTCVNC
jgi:hypothetical protein